MTTGERREREVKLELATAADHARLAASLPPPREVRRQGNHYFDLEGGPLRAAGVLLRLRIEGSGATLTVKEGARRDDAGIFDAAEREERVDPVLATRVLAGGIPLAAIGGELLRGLALRFGAGEWLRWGSLETERSVHVLPAGGLVLEVDRVAYPDGSVLHEVEAESDDPAAARERVIAILERAGVSWRPSAATKAERLAEALAREA
jgi:uncharacterized protein YjbK